MKWAEEAPAPVDGLSTNLGTIQSPREYPVATLFTPKQQETETIQQLIFDVLRFSHHG